MPRTYYQLVRRDEPALLSIVIPIYNEQDALPILRDRLTRFMDSLDCGVELIAVNDGSSDYSIDLLADWAAHDHRIKVLSLARNFGHQAAATAGLDQAQGDAVVLMDADLQDPPDIILKMMAEYRNGYDVVYGQRVSRQGETAFKRATAWAFYRVMRKLVYPDLPSDAGDFRLISRRCLDALNSMRETHRFLRGMVAWIGFPQTAVRYERHARVAGSTKYPLSKMLRLAWTAAVSFSPVPLRLSFLLGVIIFLIGFTQGIHAIIDKIFGFYTVPGWTSLMVVLCLIGGAILVSIGVLGEYVGRIFEEIKSRPLYIVAQTINLAEPSRAFEPVHDRELVRMSRSID